jgi:hypothetical protein
MTLDARIDALLERHGLEPKDKPLPIKQGNKENVVAGSGGWLGQRFPVTLYPASWLWLLRSENLEAIISFIEDNETRLSWPKTD